jgi:hypothetical protein
MTSSFPPTNTFSSRFIWMSPANTNLQVGYQCWCWHHSIPTKNFMYMSLLFHLHSTCLPHLMPMVRARTTVVYTNWPFAVYDSCSDHSEYAFSVLTGWVISVNHAILILFLPSNDIQLSQSPHRWWYYKLQGMELCCNIWPAFDKHFGNQTCFDLHLSQTLHSVG